MSAPGWRVRKEATNIGSAMLVSPVGIARRNAAGRDRCASIVKTSRSPVSTRMGNGIGSKSKIRPEDMSKEAVTLISGREFGNMAGKLEEYERLLRELSLRVDEPDQVLISKAIEKVCDAVQPPQVLQTETRPGSDS